MKARKKQRKSQNWQQSKKGGIPMELAIATFLLGIGAGCVLCSVNTEKEV